MADAKTSTQRDDRTPQEVGDIRSDPDEQEAQNVHIEPGHRAALTTGSGMMVRYISMSFSSASAGILWSFLRR